METTDALPIIHIDSDVEPDEFITRLHDLLTGGERYNIDTHSGNIPGPDTPFRSIIIRPSTNDVDVMLDPNRPYKLVAHVTALDDEDGVRVAFQATKWHVDPLTSDAYKAEAHNFFDPILSLYNLQYSADVELRFERASPS